MKNEVDTFRTANMLLNDKVEGENPVQSKDDEWIGKLFPLPHEWIKEFKPLWYKDNDSLSRRRLDVIWEEHERFVNIIYQHQRRCFTSKAKQYAASLDKSEWSEEDTKITGHSSIEEWEAYDKGRQDEEEVIFDWIGKWDGSTNSAMGDLLDKKFKEKYADFLDKNSAGCVLVKASERLPDKKRVTKQIHYTNETKNNNHGNNQSLQWQNRT